MNLAGKLWKQSQNVSQYGQSDQLVSTLLLSSKLSYRMYKQPEIESCAESIPILCTREVIGRRVLLSLPDTNIYGVNY